MTAFGTAVNGWTFPHVVRGGTRIPVADPAAAAAHGATRSGDSGMTEKRRKVATAENDATDTPPPRAVSNWAATGVFVIAVFAALSYAQAFVLPVLLAFLLSLILGPLVRFLARRRVPEFVASLALVLVVVGGFGAAAWYLSGPLGGLVTDLPRMASEIERKLSGFRAPVEQLREAGERVDELTRAAPDDPRAPQEVVVKEPGLLSAAAANAPDVIARTLFAVILLLFLLSSGDLFYAKVVRALPTLTDKKRALRIAYDIERELSRYLGTITLINLGLGICVGLAMWALGMPDPALWGGLAAALNFIPYVGSIVGIVLVGVVVLGTIPNLVQAAMAPAVYFLLTSLEGQFVTPTLVGRRLAMNPVAVFVAIAFWGWLWGIVGMLIAVPLMAAVKIFCGHIGSLQTVADFLSAENGGDAVDDSEKTS